MPRLIWTAAALGDLQRLRRFLHGKNPKAARDAVRAIRRGVHGLTSHPEAGRGFAAQDPALRERLIPYGRDGYVALYRFEEDVVYVLAVRHGREGGY